MPKKYYFYKSTGNKASAVSRIIDEHLSLRGKIKGIIIYSEKFPGWKPFRALLAHLKFVKEHHRWVKHVAFVTNADVAELLVHVAQHFVSAKVNHFKFNELEHAYTWIRNDTDYGEL